MARASTKQPPAKTVHDELLDAAMEVTEGFKQKHPKEKDQDYLKRIVMAVADAPDAIWNDLSTDAQTWFNDATDALNNKKEVELPDGYDEAPPQESRRQSGPEAAAERVNGRRNARQAAAEAQDEEQERQPAPRGRRAAAEDADEDSPATSRRSRQAEPEEDAQEEPRGRGRPPASGSRRSREEDAPQGRRAARDEDGKSRRAPPPRQSRGPSAVAEIRRMVIRNPSISNDKIVAGLEKKNLQAQDSTINSTRVFTLAAIADIKEAGRWAED